MTHIYDINIYIYLSLAFYRPFSRWTWVSRCLLDDGGGGDNWTTGAISHAKLQSNHHLQQTNIQFLYRPDAVPVAQPTVSKHNINLHMTCADNNTSQTLARNNDVW